MSATVRQIGADGLRVAENGATYWAPWMPGNTGMFVILAMSYDQRRCLVFQAGAGHFLGEAERREPDYDAVFKEVCSRMQGIGRPAGADGEGSLPAAHETEEVVR